MKKVDFQSGRVASNIMQMAIPMLVAQVLNLLYSIVDRIYIGRIPGEGTASLGAVGLCFPIIIIIHAFTNMFGLGGAPLFSIALGRKDRKTCGEVQNTSFRLLILSALVLTILGEVFGGPLLRLFGAGESELPVALGYLRIYLTGTIFLMTATGMNAFINAQGFSTVGMISVIVGAASNLILDPIFIFLLGMGVRGAAAATVLAQLLSVCIVFGFLFGRKNDFPVSFGLSFPHAREIVSLGTAPFIMQCTNSLVQIACNYVLMQFGGALYVSVMTIISSVRSILDVPVMSITEGTSPVIGYNYGASRPDQIRRAIAVMMGLALPYTFVMWILTLAAPQLFVRIFSEDPALLGPCAHAIHVYFFAFIFQSLQYSGQTVFKALNWKKHAIFFSLFRKVVMVVPLTFLFPYVFHLGTDGVFMAEPVSNVIGGLACFITMLLQVSPMLKNMNRNRNGR